MTQILQIARHLSTFWQIVYDYLLCFHTQYQESLKQNKKSVDLYELWRYYFSLRWACSSVGQSVRLITGRSQVQTLSGPPLYVTIVTPTLAESPLGWLLNSSGPNQKSVRGISSAGRARALQAWGQGFDPPILHQMFKARDRCFWPFLYGRYLKLFGYLSAAKLTASWAQVAILAVSMAHIYQTCSKYGSSSHTWRISGSARQYDYDRKVFSLYCRIVEIAYQQLSANPQAGVLL